jgi:hypothetical protein
MLEEYKVIYAFFAEILSTKTTQLKPKVEVSEGG